jgi:hypothetical protein
MSFVRAGKNAAFDLPTNKILLNRKSSISQVFSAILLLGTALAHYASRALLRESITNIKGQFQWRQLTTTTLFRL